MANVFNVINGNILVEAWVSQIPECAAHEGDKQKRWKIQSARRRSCL